MEVFSVGQIDTAYLAACWAAKAGREDMGVEKSVAAIAAAVFQRAQFDRESR